MTYRRFDVHLISPVKRAAMLCLGGLIFVLNGCSSLTKIDSACPNSSRPRRFSQVSALPLPAAESNRSGFNETRAFRYGKCPDSAKTALLRYRPSRLPRAQLMVKGPGTLAIGSKYYIELDETEVSNQEWQHFLTQVRSDSAATVYQSLLPSPAAQPVAGYFTNPFYQHFPVVGVSYAQVIAFCQWRGRVVTQQFNQLSYHKLRKQLFTYRLPTEQEWEYAAGNFVSRDYGTPCTSVRVEVNPKAAAYLKQRAQSDAAVEQISLDIRQFNAAQTELIWFACQRELPYFLRSATPDYIYSTPPNAFGLYHMIGNVAEMMQEKGVTKGGSYRDPLAACTIASRGQYSGPAPTIGFRCVSEVAFMK